MCSQIMLGNERIIANQSWLRLPVVQLVNRKGEGVLKTEEEAKRTGRERKTNANRAGSNVDGSGL